MTSPTLTSRAGRTSRVHGPDHDRHLANGGQVELEALPALESGSTHDLDLGKLVGPVTDPVDSLGAEVDAAPEFPDPEFSGSRNRQNLSIALADGHGCHIGGGSSIRGEDRLRSGSESPMSRRRTELTAYAGIVGSALAVALVLGAPWHWLALAGALVLACVPAGAAVMCWVDSGEDVAQAGLTLTVSLAVVSIASALMIWTNLWQPRALLALAVAGAVSCGARLWWSGNR